MSDELNGIEETELETEQTVQTDVTREKTLEAQKAHWRAKALRLEEEKKALLARQSQKEETVIKESEELSSVKETISELKLAEKKRQFGYLYGLSPEEADAVFRINPDPSKETLDDPFVKGGLESLREKKRLESNTPGVSSVSVKFELPDDEKATPADKQKKFDEFLRNRIRK